MMPKKRKKIYFGTKLIILENFGDLWCKKNKEKEKNKKNLFQDEKDNIRKIFKEFFFKLIQKLN